MVNGESENLPEEYDDSPEQNFGPLSLSDRTKQLIKCENLTEEKPFILIPVSVIKQDIEECQEDSDFFPYEDFILESNEDILLVLDTEQKWGEDYFICLTEDAREKFLSKFAHGTEPAEQKHHEETVEDQESSPDEDEEDVDYQIRSCRQLDSRPKIKIIVLRNEKVERKPLVRSSKMPSEHKDLYLEILPETQYYEEPTEKEEAGGKEAVVFEPVTKKTLDIGIQAAVSYDEGFSQTPLSNLANACAQTELKLFTEEEKDFIWQSKEMKDVVLTLEKRLADVFKENASGGLDVPWAAFKDKGTELVSALDASLTITKSFLCVKEGSQNMVTCIEWHPMLKDVFVAAAALNMDFEERINNLSNLLLEPCFLYIWNVKDLLLPKLLLDSCDDVYRVKFNESCPDLIAAGCRNGQLVLWDLTKNSADLEKDIEYFSWSTNQLSLDDGYDDTVKSPVLKYCTSSNIDSSHLLGINDLCWLKAGLEMQPKGVIKTTNDNMSYQIVTCGSDGCLRFWDIRQKVEGTHRDTESFENSPYELLDMDWKPFHAVEMNFPDGEKCISLTAFRLKANQQKIKVEEDISDETKDKPISSLFIAGTESGKLLQGSFNVERNVAQKKLVVPITPKFYTTVYGDHMHGGKILDISYSPYLDDIFCSVGPKFVIIWKEDILSNYLFMDVAANCYTTTAFWSPTRPAVFIIGLQDGSLRIWDFLRSTRSPQLLQPVSPAAITTITSDLVSDGKHSLAVGDADGYVYILDLPRYLCKPVENELSLFRKFIDREAKRASFQAQVQAEVFAKKAAEAKKLEDEKKLKKEQTEEVPSQVEEEPAESEEMKEKALLKQEFDEYQQLEEKCLVELGYLDRDEDEDDDV